MRIYFLIASLLIVLTLGCRQSLALPDVQSAVSTPIYDKWALIIGISKFDDHSIDLRYSAKDARDFYKFLITEGNFAPDHVKLLLNEDATRENILSTLGDKWLPRVANPNDLVVIYVSSHGSPSGMDLGGVNYIVASDTKKDSLFSTGIPMQDFVRIIKGRVHSDRIVLILDACHSGAASADGKGVFQQGNVNAEQVVSGTGQLVISSSMPDQVSWESKAEPNGVFTRYLIEGLRQKGTATKLGEAYSYMKDKVQEEVLRDRGVLQTPVLKSKWEGSDLALLALPTKPRPGLKEQPPDGESTARTVVKPAPSVESKQKIETAQPAKPALEESQLTLWNTYIEAARKEREQGNFQAARRMLQDAQKEADNFPPGDSRSTVTLSELADLSYMEGKNSEAEPLYIKVMSDLTRNRGLEDPQLAAIFCNLANINLIRSRLTEAEKFAKQASTMVDKTKKVSPATVAKILHTQAAICAGQNNFPQEEAYCRQELALREGTPLTDQIDLVKNLSLLNKSLISQEKFADAEQFAERAANLSEKECGSNSAETAEAFENYAQILNKLQRPADARRFEYKARSIRTKLSKGGSYR